MNDRLAMDDRLLSALSAIDRWGTGHAVAAVVGPDGLVASHGDAKRTFRWASVTKPVTALAVLRAIEGGLMDLEEPAGPPGSTVRHLLAHTSGLPFEGTAAIGRPGSRRIYSNHGFDLLGALVSERIGRPFGEILRETVLGPLGMGETSLVGRPSEGLAGSLADLVRLAGEFLRPTLLTPRMALALRTVAFPGSAGVVPGVGRFDPCDWGLGVEIRGDKQQHWTGRRNGPSTFGHFGGAGTFLWVDPDLDHALVCLTDRDFGPWALEVWPTLADAVIAVIAADDAR